MTVGAAFFDLDRTLMAGASAYHFGRALYKGGQMTRTQLARDAVEQIRFRLSGATDAAVNVLMDRIMEGVRGQRAVDIARLAPDVAGGHPAPDLSADAGGGAISPGRRPSCLHRHGGVLGNVAEMLAHVLAMDGAVGTRWEIVDGHYTGRLAGPFAYGEGKAVAVRQFAAEHGIDLSASYAYSDSASDLPMLEAVGHPVAVNPDAPLAEVAKREGWEVLRFEKLGQRLRIGGGMLVAAAVGGSGTWLARRRAAAASSRRRLPRR